MARLFEQSVSYKLYSLFIDFLLSQKKWFETRIYPKMHKRGESYVRKSSVFHWVMEEEKSISYAHGSYFFASLEFLFLGTKYLHGFSKKSIFMTLLDLLGKKIRENNVLFITSFCLALLILGAINFVKNLG